MSELTQAQILTAVRTDLDDAATVWSDAEIIRAITRAVYEINRVMPREIFYETRIIESVSAAHWTANATAGVWTTLTYKDIKWDSETVTDSLGNACKRDTDYYMDYTNGKITWISGGEITTGEVDCHISYSLTRAAVDLSSLTDLIKVESVYHVSQPPKESISFEVWNNLLLLGSGEGGNQKFITSGDHVVIKYHAMHTEPGASAGSFPTYLDNFVILLVEAFCLLNKSVTMQFQANTDFGSGRTALGAGTTALASISAVHTLITSDLAAISHTATTGALDKVDTYLAGASESTKALLAKITTDAASLRTAISTAADAISTALGLVASGDLTTAAAVDESAFLSGGSAPSGNKYLDDGDALINTVNAGENVPENYAKFAEQAVNIGMAIAAKRRDYTNMAAARVNQAMGYMQAAQVRINNLAQYIEQAKAYGDIAGGFVAEATTRVNDLLVYIQSAQTRAGQIAEYVTQAQTNFQIAAGYFQAAEGDIKLAESFHSSYVEHRNEAYLVFSSDKMWKGISGTVGRP